MKTIKVQSNYGRFATELTITIGDDINPATEKLCKQGGFNILYRVCGSYVDKALGVGKGENDRFPKRNLVEYSEEEAEKINAAVSEKLTEIEEEEGLEGLELSFRVTGEHFYGEGQESAMARASLFVDSLLDNEVTAPQLRSTLKVLGMDDADTASRDAMVKFAHSKGLGIQKKKNAA